MKWDAAGFWGSEKRARGYAKRDFLCPPEKLIIERFKDQWRDWRLLDLGVGGGRTTLHFAPLVKEYVGTDFAPTMIQVCEKRFEGCFKNARFIIQDVQSAQALEDNHFDFAMFSYNGLGELQHEDIRLALGEIRRVLKPNAYFFFSQHNILWVHTIFKPKFSKRPDRLLKSMYRTLKFRSINPSYRSMMFRDYAEFHDYPYDFKKLAYYVSPSEQIRQLEQVGYGQIEVFLNSSAKSWHGDIEAVKREPFLHYLCQRKLDLP